MKYGLKVKFYALCVYVRNDKEKDSDLKWCDENFNFHDDDDGDMIWHFSLKCLLIIYVGW